MNNPIVVTDRALSYYDERLKEYISSSYGSDMIVDWEPMEDGKNPFKLRISLKSRQGAELFSTIVDFPLEQTVISGEYKAENKALVLYFRDGTYTEIPVRELIEGLATYDDLSKKADRGTKKGDGVSACAISVPNTASPYAAVQRLGGTCHTAEDKIKVGSVKRILSTGKNLIDQKAFFANAGWEYSEGAYHGEAQSLYSAYSGRQIATIPFKENTRYRISFEGYADSTDEKRTVSVMFSINYTDGTYDFLSLSTPYGDTKYSAFSKISAEGKTVKGITITYSYGLYSHMKNLTVCEDTGDTGYIPYECRSLDIPEGVQLLDGYGMGINGTLYNYIDFSEGALVKRVAKYTVTGEEHWIEYGSNDTVRGFWTNVIDKGAKDLGEIIANKGFNHISQSGVPYRIDVLTGGTKLIFTLPYADYTLDTWRAQLREWYTSGEPLEFVYELKTEERIPIEGIREGIIPVTQGGAVIFEGPDMLPVPVCVDFYLGTNGIVSATELIGELKGVATASRYYMENGNISGESIASALKRLSTEIESACANSIKVTVEQLSALSTLGATLTASVGVISNPPISVNDVVLDKYSEGDASYLSFWQVTGVSTTDITLRGLGNMYVGGGSASIADKAVSDSDGNKISDTYVKKSDANEKFDSLREEKADLSYVQTLESVQGAQAERIDRLREDVDGCGTDITHSWEPADTDGVNPFKLRLTLTRVNGETAETVVDFPLEQMVTGAEYDKDTRSLVLHTPDGYVTVPVEDIFRGLITESNIGEQSVAYAAESGFANKSVSFRRSDGTDGIIENIESIASASTMRANEAYTLAEEAKNASDSFDTSKASQEEVDAISRDQSEFQQKLTDGGTVVHTARYAEGNKVNPLSQAIRSCVMSQGKLIFYHLSGEDDTVNLLSDSYVSSLATALSTNDKFIDIVVEGVLKEMGY